MEFVSKVGGAQAVPNLHHEIMNTSSKLEWCVGYWSKSVVSAPVLCQFIISCVPCMMCQLFFACVVVFTEYNGKQIWPMPLQKGKLQKGKESPRSLRGKDTNCLHLWSSTHQTRRAHCKNRRVTARARWKRRQADFHADFQSKKRKRQPQAEEEAAKKIHSKRFRAGGQRIEILTRYHVCITMLLANYLM